MTNIYEVGQCTYWCFQVLIWIQRYGNLGNAKDWLKNAVIKGLQTGSTAQVGAAMVLQPGVQGASDFGHVAVVTALLGGGQFRVSQMDVPVGNSNPTVGTFHEGSGVGFIYPPPSTPAEKVRYVDMVAVTRTDGRIDTFDVDPSGKGWHSVIGTDGICQLNEEVPGSWSSWISAHWSADSKTLTATGRGWQSGQGGQSYQIVCVVGSNPPWTQPEAKP